MAPGDLTSGCSGNTTLHAQTVAGIKPGRAVGRREVVRYRFPLVRAR